MREILDALTGWLEPTSVLLAMIILLLINAWAFRIWKTTHTTGTVLRRTINVLLVFVGVIVFILSLPIDQTIKGQILSFLGIIISAGIALSSTTILGNLIAGIMNNSMKRFSSGDLIKIGDLQGRVMKKSVFHTEIQLEDSNFVTIPNLYIATHPVKLTRKTKTVISSTVSLGYEIPRLKVEEALKEAAEATGLSDPYLYITELGDYSVTYRIHGFLEDSSKFFSTSSLLNAHVLDKLHGHGIEIVSPTFMNQRRVDDVQFMPQMLVSEEPPQDTSAPEDLIFDEAIKSEEIEKKRAVLKDLEVRRGALKEKLKGTGDKVESEKLQAALDRLNGLQERIERNIEEQTDRKKE
jgi:small-conductance mechanosensitive channel